MKKLLIITSLVYLTGCNANILDPRKPWIIDYKNVYTEELNKIGMARYRVTDGDAYQSFDDKVAKYNIGDTLHGSHIKVVTTVDTLIPPQTDTSQIK
jgi:hypothetical protein